MDRRGALRTLAGLPATLALLSGSGPARAALDGQALERAAATIDLHSLLVWQRGAWLMQHYRRSSDKPIGDWFSRDVSFGPEVLHDMRSISKSVVALLVGQAVARGQIDIDRPVLDFYPELAALRSEGREGILLSHLLDMSSGLAWNESTTTYGTWSNDETRLLWDRSPARYVLDRALVAAPGSVWNYNGGGTTLLAEVLEQRTGRGLVELARDDLFKPLGITNFEWRTGLHGKPLAYAGLRLTPPDLMKIGQMMLNGGRAPGVQGAVVVSAEWVSASLSPRVRIEQRELGYSRQWWCGTARHDGRDLPWAAGIGNGGQRLFILPALDLAVVFTAGVYNSGTIGRAELDLFRQIVSQL